MNKKSRKYRRLYAQFVALASREKLSYHELGELAAFRVKLKMEKPSKPISKKRYRYLCELSDRLLSSIKPILE